MKEFYKNGKLDRKLYLRHWRKLHPKYGRTFMLNWRNEKFYSKGLTSEGRKVKNLKLSEAHRRGGEENEMSRLRK